MIKIQEHLDRPDADLYLDSLALKMWNHLNKTVLSGEYRHNSLIKKLDRLIVKANTANYLIEVANNNHLILKSTQSIFGLLTR